MRTAYVVMDLVNDLVHEAGPNGADLGKEAARRGVIANTALALERARAAKALVGFVRVGFDPLGGYADCSKTSPLFSGIAKYGILKLGTWGTELHEGIDRRPGELDIVKQRVSPFHATHLEAVLRANAVERLVLSGVSTNFVVNSGVREGHDRDYEVVVLQDCCSAGSQAEHDRALESFAPLCKEISTAAAVAFGT